MKFGMKRNEAGFSLVELMIVVGIIGILASLAMPKMQVFMAKARQSEVKGLLSNIFALQQSYFIENNTYGNSSTKIGYTPPAKGFYTADATYANADTDSFDATLKNSTALCEGTNAGVNMDVWVVDHNRNLTGNAPKCN
jgi:type IV pilus assembly protein PilA